MYSRGLTGVGLVDGWNEEPYRVLSSIRGYFAEGHLGADVGHQVMHTLEGNCTYIAVDVASLCEAVAHFWHHLRHRGQED